MLSPEDILRWAQQASSEFTNLNGNSAGWYSSLPHQMMPVRNNSSTMNPCMGLNMAPVHQQTLAYQPQPLPSNLGTFGINQLPSNSLPVLGAAPVSQYSYSGSQAVYFPYLNSCSRAMPTATGHISPHHCRLTPSPRTPTPTKMMQPISPPFRFPPLLSNGSPINWDKLTGLSPISPGEKPKFSPPVNGGLASFWQHVHDHSFCSYFPNQTKKSPSRCHPYKLSPSQSRASTSNVKVVQAKAKEEHKKKAKSFQHALRRDVFMGYSEKTETTKHMPEERTVTPLSLLEIDNNLDWSADCTELTPLDLEPVDDDQVFNQIQALSQALTR